MVPANWVASEKTIINERDTMHIREATLSDYRSFKKLQRQIHQLHVQERPDIYLNHRLDHEQFSLILNEKTIYLLEEDADILAYAIIQMVDEPEDIRKNKQKRKIVVIDEICVEESYRSQGIGQFLFGKIILLAREVKAQAIELGVWEFNQSAIKFYELLGMRTKTRRMELILEDVDKN